MTQNLHSIQPQQRATVPAVTDDMPIYYGILTDQGQALLAAAIASGAPLPLTAMAAGDGGGQPVTPLAEMTELVNEVHRAPLNQLFVDHTVPNQIVAEMVMAETVGGFWIRELGLFAESGELFAVCNTPDSYKPVLTEGAGRSLLTRMILIVSDTSAVELIINPDTVMASLAYVDAKIAEHAASRDHPAATEGAQGMLPLATQAMVNEGSDHASAVTPQTANLTFARLQHEHEIDDVLWLQEALDEKAEVGHTHTPEEAGAAPVEHGHEMADISGLQGALDGKAEIEHQHQIADVEGLDEVLAAKRVMAQIVLQAPGGAVAGIWYPVLIHLEPGSSGTPVNIHTVTGSSSLPMNFNSYVGLVGMGGWSDRGSQHAGNFFRYHPAEHAISCMAGPTESGDHVVFYVEGRGFPVVVEWPDNLQPPVTSANSITLGTSVYTPSTVDGMPAGTNAALITAFEPGTGFYSNAAGQHYGTQFRPTPADIGAVAKDGSVPMTGTLGLRSAASGNGAHGVTVGGPFASLETRFAPFSTAVSHTGSSFAPSMKMAYHNTAGWEGFWAFGHLSGTILNAGALAFYHINGNGGEEAHWLFDPSTKTIEAQGQPTTAGHLTRKDYVDGQVNNHAHFETLAALTAAFGTTYTNTSGKTMFISVTSFHGGDDDAVECWVNGNRVSYASIAMSGEDSDGTNFCQGFFVPNGGTWGITQVNGTETSIQELWSWK